jgi:hypothetical protein
VDPSHQISIHIRPTTVYVSNFRANFKPFGDHPSHSPDLLALLVFFTSGVDTPVMGDSQMKNKTAGVVGAFMFMATFFSVGLSSVTAASCTSKPNIFKGVDTVCTDGTRTSTKPNIFGGFDTYDKSGRRIASSKPNIFGGTDTKNASGQTKSVTKPNIFGGKNITNGSGATTGYTKPNIFGGYDVYDKSGRRTQVCKPNIRKGYDCR